MRNLAASKPRFVRTQLIGVALGICSISAGLAPTASHAQFQELVKDLPPSANAVLLLNVEKAKESPLGIREGWSKKLEKAFTDGLIRVPPQSVRVVLASEFDFETMHANWESALVELSISPSMSTVAATYGGKTDQVEGLEAALLPRGTYLVKLRPQTLAAIVPANRQFVTRWLREIHSTGGATLSPYLIRAAGYSDDAASEIIMAMDLSGALSVERIKDYLASKEWLKQKRPNMEQLASVLQGVQGIRLGIRIGEQPFGRIAIDFASDPSPLLPYAKQLLLETLTDSGMRIDDFEGWKEDVRASEIGLQGTLSTTGLRQVLSLMESPVPSSPVAADQSQAPQAPQTPSPSEAAAASLEHFKAVVGYLHDLKMAKREVQSFAQHAVFFDRYANKIEKLPILNVDKELIEYSAFVAQMLRQGSQLVRNTGIRTGAQQASVSTSTPDVYAYGYVNNWYGGYGYARYAPYADMKYEQAQKRIVRKENQGSARAMEQDMKAQIIAATNDIRTKMTQKYQIEFPL